MSDIEDDSNDELDFDEYFYVEDTYDEVGDLAEHAIASPPPFDDDEDSWEWDRFAYWNDIEYDSDGYHDIDTERLLRQKGKGKQPPPKGKLKRRLEEIQSSPAKRRKGRAGATHELHEVHKPPKIVVSPVGWRRESDEESTPLRETQEEPFALLKDWREQFPEPELTHDTNGMEEDDQEVDETGMTSLQIGQDAIMAALRANLGKLSAEAGAGTPGADEQLLMQHLTKMLSEGGASLDDIAGDLADALFAPDDESVASDALHEKKGDGDFGQWVLKQAEGQAGPGAASRRDGELSPPADDNLEQSTKPTQTPVQAIPANRRPPTPASAESSGSSQKHTSEAPGQPLVAMPSVPASRKRKAAASSHEDVDTNTRPKRTATRSFDAPTASSKAKSTHAADKEKQSGRTTARKASKSSKK